MEDLNQAQPVLRLTNITKRFGAVTANDGVGFVLRRGEVVALLGENGAGKTTLMNILFGQYTPDAGEVEVFGKVLPAGQPRAALEAGVGMVHQHFTLAENLRVWENIALGTTGLSRLRLNATAIRKRIHALAETYQLDVDPNAKLGRLSVGERQRVEILKALYRDARILILDEPTAVLTPQESDTLFSTLRNAVASGLSIIFISHKLHEVMAVSDRVLVLRHGRLVAQRAIEETTREELARLMVGGDVVAPSLQPREAGQTRVALRDVKTAAGLKGVSLELKASQITGLAGVSGNGQAALFELLAGLDRPTSGALTINGQQIGRWSPRAALRRGLARIPEDRHRTGTVADFDLIENTMLETYQSEYARAGWLRWGRARKAARELIADYDIRCPGPTTRIRLLSGGNMQKLILGRALRGDPKIILANQPVRGLDIGAVNYVHKRLAEARDAGAAILLISEDLDEILTLSDVIHVMSEGRLSPAFPRGTMQAEDLGIWMAGEGFEKQVAHAS